MKKGNIFYEMIGITLATALVAASVYFFLIPSDLPLGSISGLAMLLSKVLPLSMATLTMILNVSLLILGFILLGREFGIKTVYTIHNLQYQGVFGIKDVQDTLGLGDSLFTPDKLECYGCANYMKAGLVYADELTTVSPSYSDEIQTAFYGERLDGLLRARKDQLSGILNGIDTALYDPATMPSIAQNFTPKAPVTGKKA